MRKGKYPKVLGVFSGLSADEMPNFLQLMQVLSEVSYNCTEPQGHSPRRSGKENWRRPIPLQPQNRAGARCVNCG